MSKGPKVLLFASCNYERIVSYTTFEEFCTNFKMSNQRTAIVICGPTAVGKTDFAIRLALQHKTEILSADSRQCYRELNIGVAKPDAVQLNTVKHYFINSHSVTEEVTAAGFEQYGLSVLADIFKNHDTAVIAGGTGLYVKALLEGMDEIPPVDLSVESEIKEKWKQGGLDWLADELRKHDIRFSAEGEMKNPQRMLRALAVVLSTGKSILDFHTSEKKGRPFRAEKILLEMPREQLYERINRRVDQMVEKGLIDEARALYPQRSLNALQTIGYKELFDYFENAISKERAIELIKQNTRHYAKRQITWLNKYFKDEATRLIEVKG
ncbi:MAG: tRNA (adenosine(37)-N6)-dimethylallyltransferase MiaA [Chitinophagaceae bacterium]|nr:tRNA (adenosine(37)-N6)-dimethylallyltransferase MiaA [Chitinophagaceae bacterium]